MTRHRVRAFCALCYPAFVGGLFCPCGGIRHTPDHRRVLGKHSVQVAPDQRPTACTLRGVPSALFFVAWVQRLGTGPGLPQRESRNHSPRSCHPVLSDTSPSLGGSGSISQLPQPQLSRRNRQPGYPLAHPAKQPSRQMTLRQEQPIIPGMFHQPSACFHQPLLQAGERPVANSLRQHQPPSRLAGFPKL